MSAPPSHVNLISGFLGSGKTSTILHLLGQRPPAQRWAVLVNEFGALGIDGAVLGDRGPDDVRIHEIAGGCLCCASGASFRVAITRLLRDQQPDRLLIEPTGLGHAAGIVDVLREPGLAESIHLNAILCLVDAREFSAERMQRSPLYAGQLQLADVLVLNKADLADESQLRAVETWAADLYPPKHAVCRAVHGKIDGALLHLPNDARREADRCPRHGDGGYQAIGLRFPASRIFPRPALRVLLDQLRVQPGLLRIKGILRTGKEWTAIDVTPDAARLSPFSHRRDSLVELIHDADFPFAEPALRERFESLFEFSAVRPA